ncbi:phosphoglycerate mutase-like protein [Jaminaea rosea]|uniref:Phosphoglycerate mutase-like protein n=1 Tax=Jaminaea rosea TaxID=1569628 RepID=A0A316UZA5_9BASI|nr:phosphoglycerate mutase-like protein [Jaminaea rosea]PWN30324.1 phosphoglycerate mutase-like protein [Jaminaea rosea]
MKLTLLAIAGGSLAISAAVSGAAQIPLEMTRRSTSPPSFAHLLNDGNDYLDASLHNPKFQVQGQYSARYTVQSSLPDSLPSGCAVTLVNSLERHGARYMTNGSLKSAKATLAKIKASLSASGVDAKKLPKELRFLAAEELPLLTSTADLVPYGALQSYLSGRFTAQHYPDLAESSSAFVRTTGTEESDRVIVTAKYWALGFSGQPFPSLPLTDGATTRNAVAGGPQPNVVISEASGQNNTLDVSTCRNDEDLNGEDDAIAAYGASTLMPRIGSRLEKAFNKAGASINLTTSDITSLGALCPFETLARANVTESGQLDLDVSPYCSVLRDDEWPLYGYAVDAGKYYGSGYGDPYHRGIATGYLRELLARLTGGRPVIDTPSAINTTLDGSESTFPSTPAGKDGNAPRIYFDGTHDNNASPIAAAFGLFSSPGNLSLAADAQDTREGRNRAWRFSRIAPLQGKLVWERVECKAQRGNVEPARYVRVRANEAVQQAKSAPWCPAAKNASSEDRKRIEAGLCPLDAVVRGLDWVKSGDEWAKCFT